MASIFDFWLISLIWPEIRKAAKKSNCDDQVVWLSDYLKCKKKRKKDVMYYVDNNGQKKVWKI